VAVEVGLETGEVGAVEAASGEDRPAEAGVPFGPPKKCEVSKFLVKTESKKVID
jgi:hypothetical protein